MADYDWDKEFDDTGTNISVGSLNSGDGFSDFDFCKEFDSLTENKKSESEPDYDFCKEFDDVLSLGTNFSAGSTSEEKSDDDQSLGNSYKTADSDLESNASSCYVLQLRSSIPQIQNVSHEVWELYPPIRSRHGAHIAAITYPDHVLKLKEDMEIKDIVKQEALRFLPAKSLTRFKSVSKEWEQWISSPLLAVHQSFSFRDLSGYFQQSNNGWGDDDISFFSLWKPAFGIPFPSLSFLPEKVVIRSSSYGLLLCQGRDEIGVYYVCNPATGKWNAIPEPGCYHGEGTAMVLVFEPSDSNMDAHYKIVCAVSLVDQPFMKFEIYSSETRSWNCCDTMCYDLGYERLERNGFLFNKTVYWETLSNELFAFDLETECGMVACALPDAAADGSGVLANMNGELCYVSARKRSKSVVVDVYGGMMMNLKQSVSFDLQMELYSNACRVLPCVKDDNVMILAKDVVLCCCLKDKKMKVKMMKWEGMYGHVDYFPYVNSLVTVA